MLEDCSSFLNASYSSVFGLPPTNPPPNTYPADGGGGGGSGFSGGCIAGTYISLTGEKRFLITALHSLLYTIHTAALQVMKI